MDPITVVSKNRARAEMRRAMVQPILDDLDHVAHRHQRSWYLGLKKRYGWPDLKPLRDPIRSLIDLGTESVQWEPWSDVARDVPFNASVSDDTSTSKTIGNGEQRLLCQLDPIAEKSCDPTHDIDVRENDRGITAGSYEVKEIGPTKSAFAGVKGDHLAAEIRFKFSTLIWDLRVFAAELDRKPTPLMSQILKIEFSREADGRWIADVPELPGVLAYGDTREDALRAVEDLTRHVLTDNVDLNELRRFLSKTGSYIFDNGHIGSRSVADLQHVVEEIEKSVPYHAIELGSHPISREYLEHPEKIAADYSAIGRPSEIFGDLEGIFVVKSSGFALIPISEVDRYIQFERITKGQMKICLTRASSGA